MIIFEEQLGRLIALLPTFTDANSNTFTVKYGWGDINELNKYMFINSTQIYPLIWLTAGEDTHDLNEPNVKRNASIVIATKSLMQDELNPFQYNNDFKIILQPILNNLITALQRSGISILKVDTIKTNRVVNYGVEFRNANEIKTLDIWNAIIFDAEITFTSTTTCLNKIIF